MELAPATTDIEATTDPNEPTANQLERLENKRMDKEVELAEASSNSERKILRAKIRLIQAKAKQIRAKIFPELVNEFDTKNANELLDSLRRSLAIERSVLRLRTTTDRANIQERMKIIQTQIADIEKYLAKPKRIAETNSQLATQEM